MTVPPILISPGTTNYVTNPRAGTSSTGWAPGANRTADRVTNAPAGLPFGITTGLLVNTSVEFPVAADMATHVLTVDTAGPHVVSMYVWIPESWNAGIISAYQFDFAGSSGDNYIALDMDHRDDWQRAIVPVDVDTGDRTGRIGLRVTSGGWTPGNTVYLSCAQMEPGTTPTEYTDGSLGPRYRWRGTAHASISERDPRTSPGYMDLGSTHIGPLTTH